MIRLATALFAVPALAPPALAAPRDPAAAEALFAESQKLMAAQDYARACPKLEESYRLDPATGALFALALCHEKQGKLASAWVEFMDVASRASAEGYGDREKSAREHAEALRDRLAFLTVEVDPTTASLPNLVITRDGIALGPAAWKSPIPIDPGPHVVVATAPGHEPWTTNIVVAEGANKKTVVVPKLGLVPTPAIPPAAAAARDEPSTLFGAELTPLRVAGLSVGGAGVACLGLAAFSTARAISKNSESKESCKGTDGNDCPPEGLRDRAAAEEAANIATVSVIAGGVLLGTGIGLFVFGGDGKSPSVTLAPNGLRVRGVF
jgi:hypothetical protein